MSGTQGFVPAGQGVPLPDASSAPAPPGVVGAGQGVPLPSGYQAAAPEEKGPSFGQQLAAGAEQGLHDITDYPAQKLASGAGALVHLAGLAPDWHPGETTTQADLQSGQNFERQFGDSNAAKLARLGTNLVGGAAEIGAIGPLAEGLGAQAAYRLPGMAGQAAQAIGRGLSGRVGAGFWPQLGSLAGRGAVAGAGVTALTSGPSGPTPLGETLGAITGGVAGPAIAGAGSLAGKAVGVLGPHLGLFAKTVAFNKLAQMAQRSGKSLPDLLNERAQLGPLATLSDVPDRSVGAMAEGLANKADSPAAEIARSALGPRQAAQRDRIEDSIRHLVGGDVDFYSNQDALFSQRSADARPLYEKAFSDASIGTKEARKYQPWVTSDEGQEALGKIFNLMRVENLPKPLDLADYGVERSPDTGKYIIMPKEVRAPDGTLQPSEPVPSLRLLDAVRKGLWAMEMDSRDSATGRPTQYSRAYGKAARNLTDNLRSDFPEYSQALDAWAGPSQSLDALNAGRNALKQDAELTTKDVAAMPPSQKQFYRIGLGRDLLDRIMSPTGEGTDVTRQIFGSPKVRARVEAASGNPDAFATFANQMKAEHTMAASNRYLRGSQTALRQSSLSDLLPMALHALHNPAGAAANFALQHAANALSPSEQMETVLGHYLFTPEGAQQLEQDIAARQPNLIGRGVSAARGKLSSAPAVAPIAAYKGYLAPPPGP